MRIAFRLCLIYFVLYVVTTQMLPEMFPIPGVDVPDLGGLPPLRNLTLWVGTHILRISRAIPYAATGSGDKTFDFVAAFTLLVVALAATIIWTAIAKHRSHHERLFAWFRLFLRFALGTTMLTYGLAKAVPLQMPIPSLNRLIQPYGDFSPMGVLWASIGASPAYEIFVGVAEVAGGLLLFWPRTATIGALMCLMDTIAVFTLNMTYDVPVKLFSFNLVLMSLVLLAPNIRRLFDLLVLQRSAILRQEPPIGHTATARRNWVVAQLAFGVVVLLIGVHDRADNWRERGGAAPKSPLYGVWDVDVMTVDGETRAPLLTDSTRWRRLTFQQPTYMTFQRPNDHTKTYDTAMDTGIRTLTLTGPDSTIKGRLSYERQNHERLMINGTMEGHAIHLELAFRDPDSFLQRSRGFHLISEAPFNR